MKSLFDRLVYAAIGFALGALLGAAMWLLYDLGLSRYTGAPEIHVGLRAWVQCVGGFFAAVGFLFKDRVGSAAGITGATMYEDERRSMYSNPQVPTWIFLLALPAVCAAVWYFAK